MADSLGAKLSWDFIRRLRITNRRIEEQPYDTSGGAPVQIASGTSIAWQRGINNSGYTIPAWSCVAVGTVSATPDGHLAALTQPAGAAGAVYGLTGANGCPVKAPGASSSASNSLCGYHLEPGWATWDTGTPNIGEMWGPKTGQFTLSNSGLGFEIIAIIDSSKKIALVRPTSGPVLVQLTSGITARSSGTPGSGTGYQAYYSGGAISVGSVTLTILNNTKTLINQNLSDSTAKYVWCAYRFGALWIITDDCF